MVMSKVKFWVPISKDYRNLETRQGTRVVGSLNSFVLLHLVPKGGDQFASLEIVLGRQRRQTVLGPGQHRGADPLPPPLGEQESKRNICSDSFLQPDPEDSAVAYWFSIDFSEEDILIGIAIG